jgi:hypothetical protein
MHAYEPACPTFDETTRGTVEAGKAADFFAVPSPSSYCSGRSAPARSKTPSMAASTVLVI